MSKIQWKYHMQLGRTAFLQLVSSRNLYFHWGKLNTATPSSLLPRNSDCIMPLSAGSFKKNEICLKHDPITKRTTIMTLSQPEILDKIISIFKVYGAKRLILFGGYAENSTDAHDIDIACEGIQGWKLYEFAGRVENEISFPVDIVSLQPPSDLTRMIEAQGKVIYDHR